MNPDNTIRGLVGRVSPGHGTPVGCLVDSNPTAAISGNNCRTRMYRHASTTDV